MHRLCSMPAQPYRSTRTNIEEINFDLKPIRKGNHTKAAMRACTECTKNVHMKPESFGMTKYVRKIGRWRLLNVFSWPQIKWMGIDGSVFSTHATAILIIFTPKWMWIYPYFTIHCTHTHGYWRRKIQWGGYSCQYGVFTLNFSYFFSQKNPWTTTYHIMKHWAMTKHRHMLVTTGQSVQLPKIHMCFWNSGHTVDHFTLD